MAADYLVTISVNLGTCAFASTATLSVSKKGKKKKRKVRVRSNPLHVKHNQTISWTCADGNFCGVFKSDSPLADAGFSGLVNDVTDPIRVTARHKASGTNTYSYAVAVVRAGDGKVCSIDPDIIIDA